MEFYCNLSNFDSKFWLLKSYNKSCVQCSRELSLSVCIEEEKKGLANIL